METEYEVIAAVAGNAVIDMDALDVVLDWALPDECLLLIADPPTQGTERIIEWCDEVGQDYIRTTQDVLDNPDHEVTWFIVLGVEGSEHLIYDAWNYGIEVFDLTRAMYPVTQGDDLDLVVYEPQTQPHEISDGLGGRGSLDIFAPQDGSESRTEASDISWPDDDSLELSQKELVRRLIEEMAGLVKAHEERYHSSSQLAVGFAVADPSRTDTDSGQAGGSLQSVQMSDIETKIRCIKNKDGKVKVSPRAKPKTGEEVIWLTQEEVDQLED